MKLRSYTSWLGMMVVLGAVSAGCRDDATPTPTADTASSASAGDRKPRTQLPKMTPQATKQFRVDSCYFGTLSMRMTRDAYLASLGGAEPSAEKIPTFGEFPDLNLAGRRRPKPDAAPDPSGSAAASPAGSAAPAAPTAAAKPTPTAQPTGTALAGKAPGAKDPRGRAPMMAPRLPFVRYVHSCTLAKNVPGGADPKIDEALKSYEEYVVALNKTIMQTTQYYTRKEQEKDSFAKGKELHKQLTEAFAKLDEQLDAFGTAVQEWRKGLAKLTDDLGPTGDLAIQAVDEARSLTFAAMAKEPDAAAIKASIDKLDELAGKLEKEGETDPKAAFPRAVGPTLRAFVDAATEAHAAMEAKELSPEKLYMVTGTFTALSESCNRGITRHLYSSRGGRGPGASPDLPRRPTPARPRPDRGGKPMIPPPVKQAE